MNNDKFSIIKSICPNVMIDCDMKKNTSFGIGGNVKYLVYPESKDELKKILKFINKYKMQFYCLGSGSNLLIDDKGFNGIVISLKKTFKKFKISDNRI